MTDWQFLFNIAVGISLGMGGWIAGRISKSLDRFDADLRALPEKYVSRSEFNRTFDKIDAALQRIEEKLDNKADKGR